MENQKEIISNCTGKLAKELPVLRKMCNLTQKDLGDIAGVSRQTITNIESGKCEMKWTLFLALMLLFSFNKSCTNYIKDLDIPDKRIKDFLLSKVERDAQTR